MKRFLQTAILSTMLCCACAEIGHAENYDGFWDGDRWRMRGRVINVTPDESSTVNIGGRIQAEDAYTPEVDFTYFFTPHIAAELILATSKHELSHNTAGALGDAWLLPPTLTLQYHPVPDNSFSPYFGAGINYSVFYAEDAAAGFTDLNVDNGVGFALQAGFDYWLNDKWAWNMDVKKLFLNVDASLNNGAVTADIDMDPWVFGVGFTYQFGGND